MEISRLSKICNLQDVFVDIKETERLNRYEFFAYKNNRLLKHSSSELMKFEDFLSLATKFAGPEGKLVVNDLEINFDEICFSRK